MLCYIKIKTRMLNFSQIKWRLFFSSPEFVCIRKEWKFVSVSLQWKLFFLTDWKTFLHFLSVSPSEKQLIMFLKEEVIIKMMHFASSRAHN